MGITLIDQARMALRSSGNRPPEVWRDVYEAGLAEAYRTKRHDEAAELAMFAAVCLESQGLYREAIGQLDYAIDIAEGLQEVQGHLLCVKAGFEAIRGEWSALSSISAARQSLEGSTDARRRHEYAVYRVMVDCILFEPLDPEEAVAVVVGAERDGFDWLSAGLKVWLIPWLYSLGRRPSARPWIDALRTEVEVKQHGFRLADARSFEAADAAVDSVAHGLPPLPPIGRAGENRSAAWRHHTVTARAALIAADWTAAAEAFAAMERLSGAINPGRTEGLPLFRALIDALRDVPPDEPIRPPDALTLNNLPSVLAGVEAVAIGGSQGEAVQWSRWLQEHIPPEVRTSLDWPVSFDRVRGLLLARTGDTRRAVTALRRALRWSEEAGYRVEHGLVQVQLAELLALGDSPGASERDWQRLRRAGREALAQLGAASLPHAYAADRALALGRRTSSQPRLTPRETEVLRLLKEGWSYREIGAQIGTSWRTVQTHAYTLYQKLEVNGKMRAVARAEELGIL